MAQIYKKIGNYRRFDADFFLSPWQMLVHADANLPLGRLLNRLRFLQEQLNIMGKRLNLFTPKG